MSHVPTPACVCASLWLSGKTRHETAFCTICVRVALHRCTSRAACSHKVVRVSRFQSSCLRPKLTNTTCVNLLCSPLLVIDVVEARHFPDLFPRCAFFLRRDLLLCLPCLVIGVLWSWVSRRYQHFAVLPITMLAVPVLFFVALSLSGQSMQVCNFGCIRAV